MKIKKLIIINTTILLGTIVLVTGCNKTTNIDTSYNSSNSSSLFSEDVENNNEKVINSQDNTQESSTLHNDDKNNINEDLNLDNDVQLEYTEDMWITNGNQEFNGSDKVVLDVFDKINYEVDLMLQSEESETIKTKAKGIFITIVDFIFYDAEINGIKFDDLTTGAKENILETALIIDNKLENKFPNYKESISEKTKKAYKQASELIKNGANNIKEFSKEKLGEDNYTAIVEAKDELVYYTKNAFDIIGDITSNIWETGKTKIKKWYEDLKNN